MKNMFNRTISNDYYYAMSIILKKISKFVAILLVVCTLGSLLPQIPKLYAYTIPQVENTATTTKAKYPTTTDASFDIDSVALVEEVDDLRTESTKTFLRADGSFVVAMYGEVVHYEKDGKWKDIDNSLTYNETTDSYENKDNKFNVKFPKYFDENKSIEVSVGDYSIKWSISGTTRSTIQYSDSLDNSSNMKELTRITQEIVYENVMNGVDIQYIVTGSKIKENILLEQYIKDFSLTFDYETQNLSLIRVDGQYFFVNTNGEVIFNLTDLYAMDANGDVTNDIDLQVVETKKDDYRITISVDDSWLSSAVYPVTIDPTLASSSISMSIQDSYVCSMYPDEVHTNYADPNLLKLANSTESVNFKALMKFTLPTQLTGMKVTYATMSLSSATKATNRTLAVYANTSPLDMATLSWTNSPSYDSTRIEDYHFTGSSSVYQFDITEIMSKWNQGEVANNGFTIRDKDIIGPYNSVKSVESGSTYAPIIEVGYINPLGIKDYWTYNSQNLGQGGTGYVSDVTGSLTMMRTDLRFSTELQNFGAVFNYSNEMATSATPNIGYGNGWNIGYNSSIHYDGTLNKYHIIDSTGNDVYYHSQSSCNARIETETGYSKSCYLSEDGSGDILVRRTELSTNITVSLVDKADGVELYFSYYGSTWYLTGIHTNVDGSNDLVISIGRNPINRALVDYVTDSVGNQLEFEYGADNRLDSISLHTMDDNLVLHEIERVYYEYLAESNYLSKVYRLSDYNQNLDLTLTTSNLSNVDTIVHYEHFSTGRLNRTYVGYPDETYGIESVGEELRYDYLNSSSNRVQQIESYFDDSLFSTITYEYDSYSSTKISDHTGDFVIYKFDAYGRTINIMDSRFNTISYQYIDIFRDSSIYGNYYLNNRQTLETSPQLQTFNPLINHSFEDPVAINNLDWEVYFEAGSAGPSYGRSTNEAYLGNYSFHIYKTAGGVCTLSQEVVLDRGQYTFRGYIMNQSGETNDQDVYFYVGGTNISVFGNNQYVPGNSTWTEVVIPFAVESNNTEVTIQLKNTNYSGVAYYDYLTISEGYLNTAINLVNNPSVEGDALLNWHIDPYDSNFIEERIAIPSEIIESEYAEIIGDYVIQVEGDGQELRGVGTEFKDTDFTVNFHEGGTIMVGGWAYYYSGTPLNRTDENRAFQLTVEFYYLDDYIRTVVPGYTQSIAFNPSVEGWQYTYGQVNIPYIGEEFGFDLVKISFEYQGEGTVYFDALSVFFDQTYTTQEFDTMGRLTKTSVSDGTFVEYLYLLDEEYYPSTTTDQDGNVFSISSSGNKILSTTFNNVTSTPSYNANGQVEGYRIEHGDYYFETSTAFTHNDQYISTVTNEFNQTTHYYSDEITGLLKSIENSKGDEVHYEYYDDGVLQRIYSGETYSEHSTSYVLYEYDALNRLVRIELDDDFSYGIIYDDEGRMDQVNVNNQNLITYSYLDNIVNLIDVTQFDDYDINESTGTITTEDDTIITINEDSYTVQSVIGSRDPSFGGEIEVQPDTIYTIAVDILAISGTIQVSVFEYAGTPGSATYIRVQKSTTKTTIGALNYQFTTSSTTSKVIVAFYGASSYTIEFSNLILDEADDYSTNLLSSQTYTNGDIIYFEYNEEDQIETIKFSENGGAKIAKFKYLYDSTGRLAIYYDLVSGITEYYSYNHRGQLSEVVDSNGNKSFYTYNTTDGVTGIEFYIADVDKTSSIEFGFNTMMSSQIESMDFTSFMGVEYTRNYHYEENALNRLDYINMVWSAFNVQKNLLYSGNTTRINHITYEINGTGVDYKYSYNFDSLGNITQEFYYEGTTLKLYRNYEYDDMNQLIVEDSRDYAYGSTTVNDTNFTKFYYYDLRGNRMDVKTFLYGQNDITYYVAPSYYQTNSGSYDAVMIYNGNKTYQNMYYLLIGQTPTLTFAYYEAWDFDHEYPLPGMTTTMTYNNLNTSTTGYYYRQYTATDGMFYEITFRVVFQVGAAEPYPTVPQDHIHYNFSSGWEDQLLNYGDINYINGIAQPIVTQQTNTYDTMGNPTYITNFVYNGTTYYGASLTWSGRELNTITIMSGSSSLAYQIRYKYNDQGYRTQKQFYTFSGYVPYLTSTISYESMNNLVIYETNGTYGILFTYDYDGTLIGFNYDANVDDQNVGFDYFYLRNQMGDITHIIDVSGNTVVRYTYDAYGNITYQTPNQTIGTINPYKYREYRYDSEIKMYYLNSRFYNPKVGRFLNADGLFGKTGDILSTNMYAYCANNPVMYSDITGYFMVGVMIASVVVSLIIESFQDYADDGVLFNRKLSNYIGAAVSGFFSGLSGGFGHLVLYGFIGNTLDYFISGEFNPETFGKELLIMGLSSLLAVGVGKALNYGASKLKANSLLKLGNNPLANRILKSMGINIRIGSRAASNLGRAIYDSGKYFFGLLIENIGCNSVNNGLLIVFD